MRWLAASDIHGSATACRRVLEAFEREKAEGLLLLGDILYHGPRNPLPEGHDPKECIRLLNEYRNHIAAVRGNCEAAVDQLVLQFPVLAEYMLLRLGKKLVFATTGMCIIWSIFHPWLREGFSSRATPMCLPATNIRSFCI